ncbi:MAG TPA: ribbon-helix-helix protein, CopG family [Dehalococcoidia bacterium]|nr:ribbon-helix-helix protein, CopG family [Dehalococcoidia bacterium]
MVNKPANKKVRTTIYLPQELHEAIRIRAVRNRVSMTQIITEVVQQYLKENVK